MVIINNNNHLCRIEHNAMKGEKEIGKEESEGDG